MTDIKKPAKSEKSIAKVPASKAQSKSSLARSAKIAKNIQASKAKASKSAAVLKPVSSAEKLAIKVNKGMPNLTSNRESALIVEAYLAKNPDFFESREDLLTSMQIKHPVTGDVISLVERRLQLLQAQNKNLLDEFGGLVEVARDNELLSGRIHLLALHLLEAQDVNEVVHNVESILTEIFNVEFVAFKFSPQAFPSLPNDRCDTELPEIFKDLIRLGRPKCGVFSMKENLCLFGETASQVASGIFIPLRDDNWQAILGIGSPSASRYQESSGILFLIRIAELIMASLRSFAQRP